MRFKSVDLTLVSGLPCEIEGHDSNEAADVINGFSFEIIAAIKLILRIITFKEVVIHQAAFHSKALAGTFKKREGDGAENRSQ